MGRRGGYALRCSGEWVERATGMNHLRWSPGRVGGTAGRVAVRIVTCWFGPYPVGEMVKPLAEEAPSIQLNTKCRVRVS